MYTPWGLIGVPSVALLYEEFEDTKGVHVCLGLLHAQPCVNPLIMLNCTPLLHSTFHGTVSLIKFT
jgi:hypothetical protein